MDYLQVCSVYYCDDVSLQINTPLPSLSQPVPDTFTAVSAESITASVPSKTALATSETSARVGTRAWIRFHHLGSNDTGLFKLVAALTICFCTPGTSASPISIAKSPRAIITPSASATKSSLAPLLRVLFS